MQAKQQLDDIKELYWKLESSGLVTELNSTLEDLVWASDIVRSRAFAISAPEGNKQDRNLYILSILPLLAVPLLAVHLCMLCHFCVYLVHKHPAVAELQVCQLHGQKLKLQLFATHLSPVERICLHCVHCSASRWLMQIMSSWITRPSYNTHTVHMVQVQIACIIRS